MSMMYKGQTIANAALGTTDAEAYAVGTREGVDVINTDKTYKNNAKYYAEEAKLAEQNAELLSQGITQNVNEAKEASQEASISATSSKQNADVAKEQAELAKQYSEMAQAATGIVKATQTQLGVIRGGDNYISEDGTLELLRRTTSNELTNSYEGGLLIHGVNGQTFQDVSDVSPINIKPITKVVVSKITTRNDDSTLESSVDLSSPISLHGVNSVFDSITPSCVKRKFAEYVITGDETIYLHDNGRIYVPISSLHNKIKSQGEVVCTIAANDRAYDSHDTGHYLNIGQSGVYFTVNETFTTAEAFIEYARSNPITIVVELSETIVEDLPTSDKTALNSLKTFNGTTHVETDSTITASVDCEFGTSRIGALLLDTHIRLNSLQL